MKKELLYEFAIHNFGVNKLMEHAFYDFIQGKKIFRFGPFPNNIPRGGDNKVIKNL